MDISSAKKTKQVTEIITHSKPMIDETGTEVRGTVMFCRMDDGLWLAAEPFPLGVTGAEKAASRRRGNHSLALASLAFQVEDGDIAISENNKLRFIDKRSTKVVPIPVTGFSTSVNLPELHPSLVDLGVNTTTHVVSAEEVKMTLNKTIDSASRVVHSATVTNDLPGRKVQTATGKGEVPKTIR